MHTIDCTVIIPTKNEQDYIVDCICSLLDTDTDTLARTEFLVVDGKSCDHTRDMVTTHFKHKHHIRIIDNPGIHQACAMNIGVKHSTGGAQSAIIRADAHAIYPKNFIKHSCQILHSDTSIGNVGCVQRYHGRHVVSKAIAMAMGSPLVRGGVKYVRASTHATCASDTAFLGCWRKDYFLRMGGFNEQFKVNEDYEFNTRIRKDGKKIVIAKALAVNYFVRNTLSGLAKQFFRYGLWKVKTILTHPSSLKARQLPPVFFVLLLAFLAIGYAHWSFAHHTWINISCALIAGLWGLMAGSVWLKQPTWGNLALIPIAIFIMHAAWGCGFLAGLIYWPIRHKMLNKKQAQLATAHEGHISDQ